VKETDVAHTSEAGGEQRHKAGLFDIRIFIGALLGVYGVILLLTGLFGTNSRQLSKADHIHINVWAGIMLIVACGVFVAWARLRPVVVPPHREQPDQADPPASQG
jgi:hypothetical protein